MSARRTFDSLRGAPDKPEPADGREPIERVMRRCFATADGERLLEWLIAEAFRVTSPNCSEAMLREAEGARRLVEKMRETGAA